MVKGSWPPGWGGGQDSVSPLLLSLGCAWEGPPRRGAWILAETRQVSVSLFPRDHGSLGNSPILQGAPLCPGGHTQAPVSGWHLSPKPQWHAWEQLAPNVPGEQPGRGPGRRAGQRSPGQHSPLLGLELTWGQGHGAPLCWYLPSKGVRSSLGGKNSSHPGGGRSRHGDIGRAGCS